MSAHDPHDIDDGECWNCAGEGITHDCIDGFCEDAESGCDLCARRCDVCQPAPKRNQELADILSSALAQTGSEPE